VTGAASGSSYYSSVTVGPLPPAALPAAAALLARAARFDQAGPMAEEKLFGASPAGPGAAYGAWQAGRLCGVAAACGRWLRLLAVDPRARRRGAGSALVAGAVAVAAAGGAAVLRTADQPGNYLTPGVDARDRPTLEWLERRGFARVGAPESWRVGLAGNPLVSAGRAAGLETGLQALGYRIRRATPDDRPALMAWINDHFSAAWAFEAGRALELGPPGVHVALVQADGALAAFAAHDGNNRGLGEFGPAGTHPAHRGRGLGTALLLRALLDVAAAGHRSATIPWVGPGEHYRRAAGATPHRRFVVLERVIG
jgi:GNAT superfamily N-acetyltransferase